MAKTVKGKADCKKSRKPDDPIPAYNKWEVWLYEGRWEVDSAFDTFLEATAWARSRSEYPTTIIHITIPAIK